MIKRKILKKFRKFLRYFMMCSLIMFMLSRLLHKFVGLLGELGGTFSNENSLFTKLIIFFGNPTENFISKPLNYLCNLLKTSEIKSKCAKIISEIFLKILITKTMFRLINYDEVETKIASMKLDKKSNDCSEISIEEKEKMVDEMSSIMTKIFFNFLIGILPYSLFVKSATFLDRKNSWYSERIDALWYYSSSIIFFLVAWVNYKKAKKFTAKKKGRKSFLLISFLVYLFSIFSGIKECKGYFVVVLTDKILDTVIDIVVQRKRKEKIHY